MSQPPSPHPPLLRASAAVYYAVASFSVMFVNKALFTSLGFQYPIAVAFLQMSFMAPICYLVAKPNLSWKIAAGIGPLAIVNVLNVVAGLIGTGGLNVPMFIVLRRFTLLLTLGFERWLYKKKHTTTTQVTVAIMMSGALIAATTDLHMNIKGYLAVFINDIFTALYLVLIKNMKAAKELSTTGLLFYNSSLCLPLLAVAVVVSGELSTLRAYPRLGDTVFKVVLALSTGLGLSVNHSQFLCTRLNEPIMTTVAGQMKNIVSTIVGTFAFGDFTFDFANAAGVVVSMIGAVWYAFHSALMSQQKQDVLPKVSQETNGYRNGKLKNYTSLVNGNGKYEAIPSK
ncbi:unnamed protein product [Ostreobium quekettii]|uniref:Sugar phosphate transporter domain-containing protein n=1 Tax=Ostreobium quekettii TaxID=121088 RepID=A0A8S1ISG7_9CHLO|nr:unnamed protein product [Ostreobium quekettii]|eukprot:evm.model.scf_1921.2 EVM.evm.TU.scf_1921.2   scf_1921:12239-17683(-)